ncbi:P-loop containing nucleoside triphosphate hydrolase protein [Dioscorea alata]|uniref:P-loop containing nucleoside triphosphate hydrolase protein n=1 Tax=Dioscorea alata TaxID=55571 RepID=A0ACB7V9S7_DIOAL|nr:P-loop containing nucleoside triphosphate hydrolase protein [Dioscorea alata]
MAVVSAFLQRLCGRLKSTIAASDQLPLNVDKELERLLKAFLAIQVTTLEAAEKKQIKSKAVRTWLCELKEAAYDADDLLDCLVLSGQEPEVDTNGSMEVVDQRRCLIFNCGQEHPVTETELMIQNIRKRVQDLRRKKPSSLYLHSGRSSNLTISHKVKAVETTTANSGDFGRDEDKEKLIKILLNSDEPSQVNLSLVAIVGKGGVGKTTFARIIYNDKEVTSYFKLKLWVTASESYDTERLSKSILSSAGRETQEKFDAQLAEGRFLLILDDVQNDKIEWEAVLEKLQLAQLGSKILITTENEQFVNNMRLPSTSYHLKGLSHGDCWSLLRQVSNLEAVASGQSKAQLEEVGMKIAAKLEGLPLAARVVGSLLCSNVNLNDWRMILNADVWNSKPEKLYNISPALLLSYQHLPPYIKQCFSYCTLFPSNHKFNKDNSVQMWMANGLIQPQPGRQIEDTGNQYLIYLVQRSLLQSSGGEYTMHSLVHSLLMAVAADESLCLPGTDKSSNQHEKTLKLSMSFSMQPLPKCMSNLVNLRHLKGDSDKISRIHKLGKLKLLQELDEFTVMSEDGHRIEELKDMKQLRGVLHISHLDTLNTGEEAMLAKMNEKEQINKLELHWSWHSPEDDISGESDDSVLEGLQPHQNLKELQIYSYSGAKTPSWLQDGYLTNLEALEFFCCWNLDLQLIGQLHCLKSLKIEHLRKLRQVGHGVCEGEEENHHLFPQLRVLHLIRCPSLKELIFLPTTLEELKLEKVGLVKLPILHHSKSTTPSSSSLLSLRILECHRLTTLQRGLLGHQNQHQLRVLETLQIEECRKLIYLPKHGFSALESLKLLSIRKCMKLRYMPVENSTATLPSSLNNLNIIDCPALTSDSFLMGLERLHSLSSIFIRGGMLDFQEEYSPHNPVLTSLPGELLQHLKALTRVAITSCYELENLGIQSLESLKNLRIQRCPNLLSCSSSVDNDESLPLEFMEIKHTPIEFINRKLLGRLTSLRELQIVDVGMVTFPVEIKDGLHCLVSLKTLHIPECTKLKSLPDELASIPRLEELYLTECRAIKSLPEKGLPLSLSMLVIEYCTLLSWRCERGGADWDKIENIFFVQVCGLNVKDPATPKFSERLKFGNEM